MTAQQRREIIVRLIERGEVSTQNQLRDALLEYGCKVTQVTISRDLDELHIKRRKDINGLMTYTLPRSNNMPTPKAVEKEQRDNRPPIYSINFQGNNCVIKTRKGYAQAVAVSIDELDNPLIMGTIAGLDTVLLITTDKLHNATIKATLEQLFHIKQK
ncbi:MAG TPA: hypothetical protein DEO38_05960 [Bacteroidales bacterium]|jgi:transcriptional regulator of arginine metabolism|nr:hypothetical protein [Bacteroidales bacterium]